MMNEPAHASNEGSAGRRVTAIVALGVLSVGVIVGWRYFKSDPPVMPTAAIRIVDVAPQRSDGLIELQSSHQQLVDEFQTIQGRAASQQLEIKKLADELRSTRQELEVLRGSFAKSSSYPDDRRKRRRGKRR